MPRSLGIDGKGRFRFVLRLIDLRVGGGVDHRMRTKFSEGGGHARAIADIELRRRRRMNRHIRRRERLDGSADLAAAAGEQNALEQNLSPANSRAGWDSPHRGGTGWGP